MNTVSREEAYFPFAQSPLWDKHRNFYQAAHIWSQPQVPEWRTTNPYLAHCYAQIALGFWRDVKKHKPEFCETFYIIELGAGSGRFAHHFLQIFLPMWNAIANSTERVCYVMSDFSETSVQTWRDNAQLQAFVQQGQLDFALFDAESDTRLDLLESGRRLASGELACPPVVIANGVFSTLRQDLFFIEHKKLYEGWLKLEENTIDDEEEKKQEESLLSEQYILHYQKRLLSNPGYADPTYMQWLSDYVQTLPTCAVLFPFKALALLDNLRKFNGRDMLLLSADRGLLNQTDLAAQYEPEWLVDDGLAFPVNYHVIATAAEAGGGTLWSAARSAPNWPVIAAATYSAPEKWPETRLAVQNHLQSFNPLDFYAARERLSEDAEYFAPVQMLAYLRLSQWDTQVFYEFFPHLKLSGLPKIQQDQWCEALQQVWRMHLNTGGDYDLAFDLASIVGSMHRWPLATELFRESLRYKGEQPEIFCNIGIAYWQLAEHEEAEKHLQKALNLWREEQASWPDQNRNAEEDEEDDPIEEHLLDLQAWQIHCRQRIGVDRLAGKGDIYLSLLGEHHAEALYLHQRNRLLAQQAGVRELESITDAREWIAQKNTNGKTPFAVLHPQFGFVGLAVLELPPEPKSRCARFYYWITPDFQNQGFASQAINLLQQYLRGLGIDHLFGCVHMDNHKSRRTLEKTEFAQLKFPVDEFDEEEISLVYYLKDLKNSLHNEHQHYQAFSDFIKAFEIPLKLAPENA